ncbi:MAG: ATP-binding cassette domain-containing protein [Oscillospiraceae bacterium]
MIEVSHLTKRYGAHLAVSDLSFNIEDGQIYGFLGPNGAGKSTTMNIMTGCLSASSGEVKIDGHDIFEESGAAKRRLGYLPEQLPFTWTGRRGISHLRRPGEGLSRAQLAEQMERVIRHADRRRRGQAHQEPLRATASAWASPRSCWRPKIVILDEPTVGLTPGR